MKSVTRKDIAREAGVSETIVSYVINDNRYVDAEKKKRVLAAVEKLGYRPSPIARALKGKTSNHVLFIADDMMSEYFGIIIGEMEKRLSGKGYMISLSVDKGDPSFVKKVLDWNFDGVIVGSRTMDQRSIQTLISSSIPTVLLAINEYPVFEGRYGVIYTGLKGGAIDAVSAMKKIGRTKIVYIDSLSEKYVLPTDYRYQGYCQVVQEPLVISGVPTQEALEIKVRDLYRKEHFDGILARTDSVALYAIRALKDLGVKVPDDVSVVGFNNSKMCEYTSPTLSSVRIRQDLIAESALNLMLELRNEGDVQVLRSELKTELIKRESL
ncbi:LacI family DNA-binding transcriptional regulator [Bullifex sp.]|uniref:LacI family DNA-binding transcriptional regulator n=1 Tax=Bullifex sp. TaxID=2815808 RepID=UPI002A7FE9BF|nr:LacI family DNA-binding transcriptional regulator [Bullifex sp.]MDY4067090.1 LacI family DNA-binding transcriptional regulator [Bullifex sp.]